MIWTSLWPRPRSRTTSLEIGLALCSTWKPRLLEQSQRTTRNIDAGATVEYYQMLKAADEAMVAEAEAVIVAEAKAAGTPMEFYSM